MRRTPISVTPINVNRSLYLPLSFLLAGLTCLWSTSTSYSQDTPQAAPISASEREPSLRVPQSVIEKAAFPVVDVHTHFYVKGKHDPELLASYVDMMDRNGIAVSVSLDGQLGTRLDSHAAFLWTKYPDRFVIFANIDFQGSGDPDRPESWACNQTGFVLQTVEQLRAEVKRGRVCGLKFFKDFGLRWKNSDGSLLKIDDPRWDPIWETCGEQIGRAHV